MKNIVANIIVLAVFVVILVAAFSAPSLPMPPDFTVAEMLQRETDFLALHLSRCPICGKESVDPDYGPLVSYCYEYGNIIDRAHRVNCWEATSAYNSTDIKWVYIGRPITGWNWNYSAQCWQHKGGGF